MELSNCWRCRHHLFPLRPERAQCVARPARTPAPTCSSGRPRFSCKASSWNELAEDTSKQTTRKHVKAVKQAAKQLCDMTDAQLSLLMEVLTEEHMRCIEIGRRIPKRNQGRQRQEKLLAQQLRRDMTEGEIVRLSDWVEIVSQGKSLKTTQPIAERRATSWRRGLLEQDGEVRELVFGLAVQQGRDLSELKQLIQKAEQGEERLREMEAARADNTPVGGTFAGASKPKRFKNNAARQLLRHLRDMAEADLTDGA